MCPLITPGMYKFKLSMLQGTGQAYSCYSSLPSNSFQNDRSKLQLNFLTILSTLLKLQVTSGITRLLLHAYGERTWLPMTIKQNPELCAHWTTLEPIPGTRKIPVIGSPEPITCGIGVGYPPRRNGCDML